MTDQQYIEQVNLRLVSYLDEQIQNAPSLQNKKLIKRIKYVTKYGKRLRPSLLFNIYGAYGGKQDIVDIGVALELLHQTLLIHDDLIDEDYSRHSRPNIAGLYLKDTKSKKIAYDQALLAGDLVHNFTINLVLKWPQILKLFNEAFITAIYGQQLDLANIDNNLAGISLKRLMDIYELKTASYSSLLPAKIAISLTGQKQPELGKITDFTKYLGIFLQLVNDHQDYFDQQRLSDYAIGKITNPYLLALKKTDGPQLKYLTKNFGSNVASKLKVKKILSDSTVEDASIKTINKYLQLSLEALEDLNISSTDRLRLVALINKIGV